MTARKTDKTEKTAGEDKSQDVETTKQAEEKKADLPTAPEKTGETDAEAAASGSVVGAVNDGDSGLNDGDAEYADEIEPVGTVVEQDKDGVNYDVPYTLLAPEHGLVQPRTSDSDDPAKSWTAQEGSEERKDEDDNALDPVALVPVQGTPGQVISVDELPNREVAEAAGIDYDQLVAGLPVHASFPEKAPRKGTPA